MAAKDKQQIDELSEDMEVVGPGQMLSDARKKIALSVDDVAEKLKFKKCLVRNIEQDIFDQKLPATFNRGYLRSYSKLVNIDADEVLSAYDMLGVAEVQRSEMQSFSNLTEKEAEHSRIMWLSYIIAAVLIGLMILWWQQEPKQVVDEKLLDKQPVTIQSTAQKSEQVNDKIAVSENDRITEEISTKTSTVLPSNDDKKEEISEDSFAVTQVETSTAAMLDTSTQEPQPDIITIDVSTAVFTFSGDCWVNIYDATGERIAWGVKKSGYVMTITGKAPLKITLGKPELAAIVFNDEPIDMSGFNVGNIAKFTLPLSL